VLLIIKRASIPGCLLAVSLLVFVGTWIMAPGDTISGMLPSTITLPSRHHEPSQVEKIRTTPAPDTAIRQHDAPDPNPVFGAHRPWRVVFTYDDGPSPFFTRRLLRVLAEHEVRAAFFVNGYWMDPKRFQYAQRSQQMLKRIHAAGHDVGNHTYNHVWLPRLTPEEQTREVMDNVALVERIINVRPRYFRPPYGTMTAHTREVLRTHGFKDIRWNAASEDEHAEPEDVASKVVRWVRAHQGGIVMLHDRLEGTAKATQLILQQLERDNCRRFRTKRPTFQVVSLDSFLRPPAKSMTLIDKESAERKRHLRRLKSICKGL